MRFIISILFFLSGMAGLIYEVLWAKHLSLFLGNTANAHTVVLATFMGGLAVGYFLFGKMVDRAGSALGLYGWMEIAIGLSGALFVPLLGGLGSLYISLISRFGSDSALATPSRFILSSLLFFLPTVLMGGTLPVLSRFVVRSLGEVESRVGWLYFLNSLGAVCGSLLAGFLFIPRLGLNLPIMVAAALNLFVGLTALVLRRWERYERDETAAPTTSHIHEGALYTPWQLRIAVLGIALSGGAALIYEIAWIRLLSLVLGSSTYSFSLMLAAFIAGIASGSFVVARKWWSRLGPYALFALAELAIALSIILTLPVYGRLPFYFATLANLFIRVPETFWLYQLINFLVCFFLMLLPTFFLGTTLPLVSRVSASSVKTLGENVGNVFAANTAGTLLGAVAAGLFLLPLLGIKRLIELGVAINLLVGAFALWVSPGLGRRKKRLALSAAFALFIFYLISFPQWDKNILSSGVFRIRDFQVGTSYEDFRRAPREEILYYKDGANMTVAVSQKDSKELTLKVNGKPDASSQGDLPTQVLLGQIPLLLKPDAKEVLVIGLGSGITCGSVLRHPVERLDVVEISPEVAEASRHFAPHNDQALEDPRLKLHLEDAKVFLKVSPRQYDVVISEPSNPWIAGVGSLYSVEFYQDVRSRLRPDGLLVQWFHSYEMTDETLRLVLRTFAAAFEHVTLWNSMTADLLLIGSSKPLAVDFKKSLDRLSSSGVMGDLRRIGISSLPTILSLQMASDAGVRRAAGKGRLNEDLFPILEYEAPKAFFLGRVSQLAVAYDERRYPADNASLYFMRYLETHPLAAVETKNLANYHLSYGPSTSLGLARNFVDLWLKRDPKDPEAHWALARLEERRGNLEAARRELEYLLRLGSGNREYLEAAAHVEFQTYLSQRSLLGPRRPEKSLAYLHRLLSLDDDRKERIYRKIAQVHAAGKDYQAALEYLEKGAAYAESHRGELGPDAIWLEAANMAVEADDLKRAMGYLAKVLARNPGNLLAKKSMQELSRLVDAAR
ncbi:MAG: fused MFS/spermidine synthase [Deltaproteobacteria bacterium]|nr:fused MFS/spermidine synthase [Deltaproteobacteria bacterium]